MKKLFLRTGKILLVLVGIFFAVEIILRITPLGVSSRMDGFGRRRSFSKMSAEKPHIRVICLGDSMTFGYKIKERFAWPTILGNRLRSIENREDIEVLNAGITGHTSAQMLARLERDVIALRPDLAIIWMGMNDGRLVERPDPAEGPAPFHRPSPLLFLESVSTAVSSDLLFRAVGALRPTRGGNRGESPTARVPLESFQDNIRRLCRILTENNLEKVLFLSLPQIDPAYAGRGNEVELQRKTYQLYNTMLLTLLRKRGVRCLDLNLMYLTRGRDIYKADGLHLNRRGSVALVDSLYPEVVKALAR